MRAKEFIIETGMHKMHPNHAAAIQNAATLPDQNMSTGSAYMNYRFGIALAGAPDYPTKAESWIGGDPLLSTYTEVEMDMIDYAAKQVGSGHAKRFSNKRSQEIAGIQKTSPIPKKQKNKYGV